MKLRLRLENKNISIVMFTFNWKGGIMIIGVHALRYAC